MSLEGLAGESCLAEALKETIESNALLFFLSTATTQKKLKTEHTQTHTTCAHRATHNLFYPKFEIVSKSQSSLIQPST